MARVTTLVGSMGLCAIVLSCGCDKGNEPSDSAAADDDSGSKNKSKKKKKKKKDAEPEPSATSSATPEPTETPPAADTGGAMIAIGADTFRAGSRCYDVPRVRPDELEHTEVALGAFEIDQFPYPNEAGKPVKLGATWQEAKSLCEARGKRLCTELEWERVCKGAKSQTYLWGEAFKQGLCDGRADGLTDQRAGCKTELGVMDMVGLSLEWTASEWERGTPTGERVVRGARDAKVSWLSARCAHSRKRDPNKSHDDVGFRCCRGDVNSAKVVLRQRQPTTIDQDQGIDSELEGVLMRGMKKDHRAIDGVRLSFDQVYRWHPVPNEEMIVARWKGEPTGSGRFYEVAVFKLCGNTAYRAASMRGPVEQIGRPKVGTSPKTLSFDVKTGADSGPVTLTYWHGSVKLTEPAFVKSGNQLVVDKKVTPAQRVGLKRRRVIKTRTR